MAIWVIREDGGSWSVRCGRIQESFTSEDAALRFVHQRRALGDKMVMEESDGYRIPLKPRRHWRRS
jgi:hypothetical protein